MSKSWESIKKRLTELQKNAPKPLIIELTYFDDTMERLALEDVKKKHFSECKLFRVVEGNSIKEAIGLLEWIAPSVID